VFLTLNQRKTSTFKKEVMFISAFRRGEDRGEERRQGEERF